MMVEQTQELTNDDGVFNSVSWLTDDLKVTHSKSHYYRHTNLVISRTDDVVRLHFGLKGNYAFTHKQLGKDFDLIGSHHNIMFSKGFDIAVQNKTLDLETFGVQFSKTSFVAFTQNADDRLKEFCDAVMSDRSVIFNKNWCTIGPEVESVIRQVFNCQYSGKMKQIFVLSKCLELLVLSVESPGKGLSQATFVTNKRDIEKLIAVRDLINERLQSPPTLPEIARIVGMNEYKLKHGFKEMFHTTIFGYLTEQRLTMAYQYLRDTQQTAAEVAFEFGYATPQHFNNAFKKRFGITPILVRKNLY